MSQCHLCECDVPEPDRICSNCGWDHEKQEIHDRNSLLAFLGSLVKLKRWVPEAKLKKRLTDLYIKKRGASSTTLESVGWSMRRTADLLSESVGTTSTDIKLAEGLEDHPELSECKNKTQAKNRLQQIERGISFNTEKPSFEFERALQRYLHVNWQNMPFNDEWELQDTGFFRDGRYDTREIGEIDLLARHRTEHKWLVIELKRNQSSDETVGQILRYMGWVKQNLEGEIQGLIISATVDQPLRYALSCVPNVSVKVYRFENELMKLKDSRDADNQAILEKLSPDMIKDLLEKLQTK